MKADFGIKWNVSVSDAALLLEKSGKRELRWYGVTLFQFGIGILVSVEKPISHVAGLCSCRDDWPASEIGTDCPKCLKMIIPLNA